MFLLQNVVSFSQNSCTSLKKAFNNSKSIESAEKYLKCLLEIEDTLGYEYASVNQKIGLLFFKEKQFEKGLDYLFVAKDKLDYLYNINQVVDKQKKEQIKLNKNIRIALTKYQNYSEGEKFTFDFINLFFDDKVNIEDYTNNRKVDFFKILKLYSNYAVYGEGKLITKKTLFKFLKKITKDKEKYLNIDKQDIYREIGYHLRTINKNPIDWETVNEFYMKHLNEAEKSNDDSKIVEAHEALSTYYIYKLYYEKRTKNNDVETVHESYKYIIDYYKNNYNNDKLNSYYETIGKYYWLSADYSGSNLNDYYSMSYYDSTSKYWEKAAFNVKNNLGIFNLKFAELIRDLKITYHRSKNSKKEKECDKILLKIKSQIKNRLDYKIVSISSSEDGNIIVAGTDDGKLKIWNRSLDKNDSDRLISKNHILGFEVEKVKVNNDGLYLISICENELKLWDSYGNFLDTTTSFNKNEIEFSSKNKCLKLSENQYVSYESGKFKKSNKEFFRTPEKSYYSTNTFDGSIEFINDNNTNTIKNSTPIKTSCAADKQPLAIGADLNGSIFIWERNSSYNFKKIDSLDLRRKPALYFISISSDSSNMLLSKKCFYKLKNEVFNNDYFDIDRINSKYFYNSSLTSKQLFDYHDSLKQNCYQNDFIIYDFSGFLNYEEIQLFGSEKMELKIFYSISEKVNSTEKLFFIDTDNNFSALLKEIMVNQLRDNENLKENKIIISGSNGQYLTESYLNTNASILDLFRKDHKYRTECLHKLYDYTPKNRDYRLKSYFQIDDFEFETENNLSVNVNIEGKKKINRRETVVILVANNTYSSPQIKSLGENPINDIDFIEKKLYSKFHINEKHIFRIVNKTKSEFFDTISDIFNKFDFERGSQLLFYFAGHGTYNNNVSSLLFKDADIKGTRGEITFEVLVKTINSNFNKGLTKSLIILDACQQGQDDNMMFKKIKQINLEIDNNYDNREIRAFAIQKASIVISSTSTNQLASNGKRGGNSPFCEAFIYALDQGSKFFTNHELFETISKKYNGSKTTLKHLDMGYKNNQSENPRFFFFRK